MLELFARIRDVILAIALAWVGVSMAPTPSKSDSGEKPVAPQAVSSQAVGSQAVVSQAASDQSAAPTSAGSTSAGSTSTVIASVQVDAECTKTARPAATLQCIESGACPQP